MQYARALAPQLARAARSFAAVILTGPRRAGKTHLLRSAFPKATYQLLESPDVLARVKGDPRGWLESLKLPVILDEIQNAPELLPWVRSFIDAAPRKMGRWLITGSQDFAMARRHGDAPLAVQGQVRGALKTNVRHKNPLKCTLRHFSGSGSARSTKL